MKSKKTYKSIVAIALVCVMLVMCMGAGYSENKVVYASDSEINFDELVAVVVFETEDGVLTAYVPLNKVAEYTNRLENEPGYRELQINHIFNAHEYENSNDGVMKCPLPPSNNYYLSSRHIMDAQDIRANIEAGEEALRELTYLTGIGAPAASFLDWVLKLGTKKVIGYVSLALGFTAVAVQIKVDSYNKHLANILAGKITGICHCVYVNTGGEYPKAWNYETVIYN